MILEVMIIYLSRFHEITMNSNNLSITNETVFKIKFDYLSQDLSLKVLCVFFMTPNE